VACKDDAAMSVQKVVGVYFDYAIENYLLPFPYNHHPYRCLALFDVTFQSNDRKASADLLLSLLQQIARIKIMLTVSVTLLFLENANSSNTIQFLCTKTRTSSFQLVNKFYTMTSQTIK
jgi:hypothetical protein